MRLNDTQVYCALLEDDQKVIKQYFRQMWNPTTSFLNGLGCRSRTQQEEIYVDAFSSLYLNVQKKKFHLQENSSIKTYLFQVCKYKWYNIVSERKRRQENTKEVAQFLADSQREREKWMEEDESSVQLRRMEEAMKQLKDRCRHILRRFYWDEASLRSISKELNLSEGSVKNAKYRCMQRLKTYYQQREP